jgi:hypothetical protein
MPSREKLDEEFEQLHGAQIDIIQHLPGVRNPQSLDVKTLTKQVDRIIPTEALCAFFKAETALDLFDGIDFAPILCEHGNIDPLKGDKCKLVSDDAWDRLLACNPDMKPLEICSTCVKDEYERIKGHSAFEDQVRPQLALLATG